MGIPRSPLTGLDTTVVAPAHTGEQHPLLPEPNWGHRPVSSWNLQSALRCSQSSCGYLKFPDTTAAFVIWGCFSAGFYKPCFCLSLFLFFQPVQRTDSLLGGERCQNCPGCQQDEADSARNCEGTEWWGDSWAPVRVQIHLRTKPSCSMEQE